MVQVTDEVAALSPSNVSLYYTTDPQLANTPLLIFHGASTTANSTLNSSRIQIHVLTAAGMQSYPRLTISPNSPFYAVVDYLPRDRQGDEVCRGLAFGLSKYFKDLSENVKAALIVQSSHASRGRRPGSAAPMFGEQHAANLASTMVKVENISEVISDIQTAFSSQTITNIDVDLVLPPGSTSLQLEQQDDVIEEDGGCYDPSLQQYGFYAPLVKLFGETAFLPTSKLRRAPSKASTLNRTRSFLKEQKLSLRREMGELVDTEERYVIKLHDLVNHIAEDFRHKAKTQNFGSVSPSEEDLQKLFPPSLDKILQINSAFLKVIQNVMDVTEEEAMQDLETDQAGVTGSRYGGSGRLQDPTGALAFAKVLLEWFPQFSDAYQDYIRASQDFPKIITSFTKQQSSFSKRLQNTGEQRLRSAVIEPVQRLPRYSLFIDNILNYLPMTHPALRPMLNARDIITAICSLDPLADDKTQVVNRLRHLVDMWPSNLFPQGRLISAVDFVEIPAPYQVIGSSASSDSGMLLLFADSLIILSKSKGCNLSARGVMAEIDKPSAVTMMASFTAGAGGQRRMYELSLTGWHSLCETRFTESSDGRLTWMASSHELKDALAGRERTSSAPTLRAFLLQGAYDGKASKWTEEVTKARIEGRFSESERDAEKWDLRNLNLKGDGLNMYVAVFEEGIDGLIEGRREPAPIRIVVDHEKGTKGAPVGHYGIEIVANVNVSEDFFQSASKLHTDGLNDRVFVDSVDATTFMPVFAKRVGDLLHAQYVAGNPALTPAFISHYSKILRSLRIQVEGDKSRSFRPPSPVKILSSFLSGSGSFGGSTSRNPRTPLMANIPIVQAHLSRNNSQNGPESGRDFGASTRTINDDSRPTNPLVRLEETFTGYIAAIQSRKGNVVGKILRNRSVVDELSVNALYNAFIENPFDTRTASEVTVDVLFATFEKFLRVAWKDQMGPVVTLQVLEALQEKALQLFPGDFADFIQSIFVNMAPQNRRAFIAIVKLLADLLEGCGNDGDRGALTVAFAELLVTEGDPQSFINLLDRLVEECDRLFEDIGPGACGGYITPQYGSVSSTAHSTRSGNTGSLTSNTSLRKRFGLETFLRQSSKAETNSGGSMWRTLSKSSRTIATGEQTSSSLSKASLNRSRSIDADARIESPIRSRPLSRDRPTVLGAFEDRPSSSHNRMTTIEASPPPDDAAVVRSLKKKRRSSLSDLKALMGSTTLTSPSSPISPLPLPSRLPTLQHSPKGKFNSSPRTPSPTKPVAIRALTYTLGPAAQKENSTLARHMGNLTERAQNIMSEDIVVKELFSAEKSTDKSHKPTISLSNIPTLKGALRGPSTTTSPARPTSSPQKTPAQKYRLQSPQKLRERLQNEAKAINAAEASLQTELSKIGEEMAMVNLGRSLNSSNPELLKLFESVRTLESKIPTMIKDLTARNETIKKDLENSLQASEYKVKGLDQLYKESSAENELLYEKFNGELGKIVRALKGKGKDDKEELVSKTKEATEEAAKVKKENARLRREMLTLRTLLKGNE